MSSLEAASQDRKARLAQLRSLKRKQADDTPDHPESSSLSTDKTSADANDVTKIYLSGRNFDAEARGPKLGFEHAPDEDQETLEKKATTLIEETQAKAREEEKDAPLDLFKLQPRKPNWDLKRDLKERMEVLDVRTENAIAALVRKRIEEQRKNEGENGATGFEGADLMEAVHVRERFEGV